MYQDLFIVDDDRFGVTTAAISQEHLHQAMLKIWTEEEWETMVNDDSVTWGSAEFTGRIDDHGYGIYELCRHGVTTFYAIGEFNEDGLAEAVYTEEE